jgi:hypothetical protein
MSVKLTKAMEDLLRYFAFSGRIASQEGQFSELSPAAIEGNSLFGGGAQSTPTDEDNPAETGLIRDLLLDITEGGRFISDFAVDPALIDANEKSNFIRICYEELSNFDSGKTPIMLDDSKNVFSAASVVSPVVKQTAAGTSNVQAYEGEADDAPPPVETGNGYSQIRDPVINTNPAMPDRYTAPSLGAIVVDKINCTLKNRNVDAAALFCAGIPPIEMSRCAPFIDMRFLLGEPTISPDNGAINTMSLLRFLGVYQANQSSDPTNFGLASAMPSDSLTDPFTGPVQGDTGESADQHLNTSNAGMELFTSPQTLVNPNINSSFGGEGETALDSRRAANMPYVIDPMQPLMSLQDIRLTEHFISDLPVNHGKATVRGTVTIMLHDRSRMVDIAPLLDISQFSETKLFLEYGWSHPEGGVITDAPNPYGIFLNSLRNRRVYNLVSGEYSLQPDGQVEITLDIMESGGAALGSIPVATGRYVSMNLVKNIINSAVSTALLKLQNTPQVQMPFPKSSIDTGGIKASDQMVPRQILIDCLGVLKQQSTDIEGAIDTILKTIESLIGTDGVSGQETISEVSSQATVLKEKIAGLDPQTATPDPFLCDIINVGMETYPKWRTGTPIILPDEETIPSDVKSEMNGGAPYVSLGKVAMSMIGAPIAASQKFDEVQLLFYPFNARAGAMWTTNIASFPMSVMDISDSLSALVKDGVGNPTCSSVFDILKEYVDSESSAAYGFSDLYQTDKEQKGESTVISSKISERMKELMCPFSKFAVPSLCMQTEVVPALIPSTTNPSLRNPRINKQICRIHIYDSGTTPYPGSQYLISLMSKDFPESILRTGLIKLFVDSKAYKDTKKNQDTGSLTSLLTTLSNDQILSKLETSDGIQEEDVYRITSSFENIKKSIMKYCPTIIVGTGWSPINSVTMRGEVPAKGQDARLEMARQEREKNPQASASGPVIGELQMLHAAIDIECMGCPIFTVGQQYFVDLGTGTMADNMYQLIKVTHTIGLSGFNSTLTLKQSSNYTAASTRSILSSMYKSLKSAQSEG